MVTGVDKYEFKLKIDEMKALVSARNYQAAAEIAETVNWRKIRNLNALVLAGEVFEQVGRYEESKEILLMAYDKSPIGRNIIYRLAEIAIRTQRIDEAQEYYDEFVDIAPHDNLKYVLKYKMTAAQGLPYKEQIKILEELKEQEYSEEWAYELAYLYHRDMQPEKCVEACDELILWFGDGIYVEKALELKMHYQPLTKPQDEKYRMFRQKRTGVIEVKPNDFLESGEIVNETVEIPYVQTNTGQYNTANLQEEIAKGMQQIHSGKMQQANRQAQPQNWQNAQAQPQNLQGAQAQQQSMQHVQGQQQSVQHVQDQPQNLQRVQGQPQNLQSVQAEPQSWQNGQRQQQNWQNGQERPQGWQNTQAQQNWQNAQAQQQNWQNTQAQQQSWQNTQAQQQNWQNTQVQPQSWQNVQEPQNWQNVQAQPQDLQNAQAQPQSLQNAQGQPQNLQNAQVQPQWQDVQETTEQEPARAMTFEEIQAEWEKTKQAMQEALQEAEKPKTAEAKEQSLEKAEKLMQRLLGIVPQLAEKLAEQQEEGQEEDAIDDQQPSGVQYDLEQAGRIVAGMNQLLQEQIDSLQAEKRQTQTPEIHRVSDPTRELPKLPEELLLGKESGAIEKEEMDGNSLQNFSLEEEDNPVMNAWKEATPGISAIDLLQRVRMEKNGVHFAQPQETQQANMRQPEKQPTMAQSGKPMTERMIQSDMPMTEQMAAEFTAEELGQTEYIAETVMQAETFSEEMVQEEDSDWNVKQIEAPVSDLLQQPEISDRKSAQQPEPPVNRPIQETELPVRQPVQETELPVAEAAQEAELPISQIVQETDFSVRQLIQQAELPASQTAQQAELPASQIAQQAELPITQPVQMGMPAAAMTRQEQQGSMSEEFFQQDQADDPQDRIRKMQAATPTDSVSQMRAAMTIDGASQMQPAGAGQKDVSDPLKNKEMNAQPVHENEQDNLFLAAKPRFLTQAQLQAESAMDGKMNTQTTKDFSSAEFYENGMQPDGQNLDMMKILTPEQKQIFSYFVPIAGMEAQIYDLLEGVSQHLQYDKHALSGNIMIEGISGSGKTVLIMDIIKVLQKEIKRPAGKTGKIDANALNQKDLDVLMEKINGGCLIIESAGKISRETAVKLSRCMENDHTGTLYIIEDTAEGIQKALERDSSFASKFTEKITIPLFSADELVEFGKAYANDLDYDIDEMGVLALYKRISNIQKLDHVTTLTEVKEIVDEAIENAERGVLKKVFGMLTATRANDDNYVILREKDFEE